MEGVKIYEESNKELHRIIKQSGSDEIRIDVSKLDSTTKGEMITAIRNVAHKRVKEIEKVILGVQ